MFKSLISLTFFALLIHLKFMSPWLEDWDSVQFAMALHHFDLGSGIPHPPGYPLYILLAKFFYLFFQDDNQTLTFLSALLGSLTIIPLFLLAKKMFGKLVAFFAAALFILMPVSWTLSEVALTNIPGQFFLSLFAFLLYKLHENKKAVLILSFCFGLILGFRFTEFPVFAGLLGFVFIQHKSLKLLANGAFCFLIGLFSWLLPLILYSGFDQFVKAYSINAGYIFKHDTLLGLSTSKQIIFRLRLLNLWEILKIGFSQIFILISAVAIIFVFIKKKYQDFSYKFLLIWLFSYSLFLLFIFNLEVTRYTLPLLAPLSILVSGIILSLKKFKFFGSLFLIFILILLFQQSYDQVSRFKTQIPPTIAPVLFTKKDFDSKQTLIIPTLTLRHFQYYAPQFKILDPEKLKKTDTIDTKLVIIDHLSTKEKFDALKNYSVYEQKNFSGDHDIYNRVNSTNLYLLIRKPSN